jgi:hypothetical protein
VTAGGNGASAEPDHADNRGHPPTYLNLILQPCRTAELRAFFIRFIVTQHIAKGA